MRQFSVSPIEASCIEGAEGPFEWILAQHCLSLAQDVADSCVDIVEVVCEGRVVKRIRSKHIPENPVMPKKSEMSADQVADIRRRLDEGESVVSIARLYKKSESTIRDIRCGAKYAGVGVDYR